MGIINKAFIGAAIYFGYKYLAKKDTTTGRSTLDEIIDDVPKYIDKAKSMIAREKQNDKKFI